MASKSIPRVVVVLRVFTLLVCVTSGLLLFFDNFTLSDTDQLQWFQDVVTFRYVMYVGAIGAIYNILQLPFGLYYISTQKDFIPNGCMPEFDFYADKVVSLILWWAVGAGFGAGVELKNMIEYLIQLLSSLQSGKFYNNLEEVKTKNDDFYDKAIISTAILLLGAVCMAVVSVLNSITRTSN